MGWINPGRWVEVALAGWLVLVGLMLLVGMARGSIPLRGMLGHTLDDRAHLHKLQLLAVTLAFALGYVATALQRGPGDAMPGVSPLMLAALLGSQGAYLTGKYRNTRRYVRAQRGEEA
jgi:hypothetical protein